MAPDILLHGMTWDHRRAVDPLVATLPAFHERHPKLAVTWSSRPLHGFEFAPVDRLAKDYDLIVLDHPFAGAIAATACLLPVDRLVEPLRQSFIGPSLETYEYRGHVWALPIDAASQTAVSRPDLLQKLDAPAPSRWDEVLALGHLARRRGCHLAIGLKGVHSLMTFFTLSANLGHPCGTNPRQPLIDAAVAREVLSLMRELLSLCAPDCLDLNSIALHEAMVERDDLVFCPAVYCYATYAESDKRRPLRFHDFPGPNGPAGSTIGGTGLGISAHCRHPDAAFAYARYLTEAATQFSFAAHHGQPARVECWNDETVNAQFGNCYRATRQTMERAWIRPRYDGYLAFQARGGELIEQHLRGNLDEAALLRELNSAFAASGGPNQISAPGCGSV
jgi:multiple sugar transport system substrate-binding protein